MHLRARCRKESKHYRVAIFIGDLSIGTLFVPEDKFEEFMRHTSIEWYDVDAPQPP